MFETLKNYIKNENYLVSLSNKFLHFYNYKTINGVDSNKILIAINEGEIIIKGKNLLLKKLDKQELLITGEIKAIETR